MSRASGRAADELRQVSFMRRHARHAEGSVLVQFGDTQVLCTASVEDTVPPFLRGKASGWITAEYGMLPRATGERTQREAARGGQGGRTMEIQRLIGRALRDEREGQRREQRRQLAQLAGIAAGQNDARHGPLSA